MKVFYGTIINPNHKTYLDIRENCAVGVDQNGKIAFVENCNNRRSLLDKYDIEDCDIRKLRKWEFLCPGFVDTHIHASQYNNAGTGLSLPLLEWLEKYTFPLEAKFEDKMFTHHAINRVVQQTLRQGTTTAAYYVTIHTDASLKMCDVAENYGQRAIIGKVCMDTMSPGYYCEQTEDSLKNTEKFISEVLERQYKLITPSVIPRFALSCTEQLLKSLGRFSRTYDIPVQTHLSEAKDECRKVGEVFPQCENYVDVYDKMGLLHEKTILGHAIHISDAERKLIADRKAAVAHCPISNFNLKSGLCDVRRLLDSGIRVGLGTDVSGGYDHSILNTLRTAIHASTALGFQDPSYKILSYSEAFYLATLGGANAIGLGDKTGSFEVGKELDALLVDMAVPNGIADVNPDNTPAEMFEKFLVRGDDRNIKRVYVSGKQSVPFMSS